MNAYTFVNNFFIYDWFLFINWMNIVRFLLFIWIHIYTINPLFIETWYEVSTYVIANQALPHTMFNMAERSAGNELIEILNCKFFVLVFYFYFFYKIILFVRVYVPGREVGCWTVCTRVVKQRDEIIIVKSIVSLASHTNRFCTNCNIILIYIIIFGHRLNVRTTCRAYRIR